MGRVWGEFLESVGRMWGECGESGGRVWEECGERVERVERVLGHSIHRNLGFNFSVSFSSPSRDKVTTRDAHHNEHLKRQKTPDMIETHMQNISYNYM